MVSVTAVPEILALVKKPDLLIYIDLAPSVARERITERNRGGEEDGISVSYLSALEHFMSKRDQTSCDTLGAKLVRLDATRPVPQVCKAILDRIYDYFEALNK